MTKSEMDYYDWSLLGPAMLFLNQYFNHALPEYYVLWLCTVSSYWIPTFCVGGLLNPYVAP